MPKNVTSSEQQPHDRLTSLCDDMTVAMEASPHYRDGDKCIIFIDSDSERRGGLVMSGYDDNADAMSNIFGHLTAVFEANGSRLEVVPLPVRGQG